MKFQIILFNVLSLIPILAINSDDESSSNASSPNPSVTLDLSSPLITDEAIIRHKELDNIEYSQISQKEGFDIKKIVDDDEAIWGDDLIKLKSGAVVYVSGKPVLFYMVESGQIETKYYGKFGGRWEEISNEEYIDVLNEIKYSTEIRSRFAMDLSFLFENSKYKIESLYKNYVRMVILTPLKGHMAQAVNYRGTKLWKGDLPGERCITAIAYNKGVISLIAHLIIINNEGEMNHKYYVSAYGNWEEVPENKYLEAVISLKESKIPFIPSYLDLSSVDSVKFSVTPETYERPCAFYEPKHNLKISTVFDGDHVIWRSPEIETQFAYALSVYNPRKPTMVVLHLNYNPPNYELCFKKTEDGWVACTREEVEMKVKQLQVERYSELDVQFIDDTFVNIVPFKQRYGDDYYLISPKPNHDIMIVKDGCENIWNYGGLGSHFLNGRFYFFEACIYMVQIRIMHPTRLHEDLYFCKQAMGWERLTKDEFVKQLSQSGRIYREELSEIAEELTEEITTFYESSFAETPKKETPKKKESPQKETPEKEKSPEIKDSPEIKESHEGKEEEEYFKAKFYESYGDISIDAEHTETDVQAPAVPFTPGFAGTPKDRARTPKTPKSTKKVGFERAKEDSDERGESPEAFHKLDLSTSDDETEDEKTTRSRSLRSVPSPDVKGSSSGVSSSAKAMKKSKSFDSSSLKHEDGSGSGMKKSKSVEKMPYDSDEESPTGSSDDEEECHYAQIGEEPKEKPKKPSSTMVPSLLSLFILSIIAVIL